MVARDRVDFAIATGGDELFPHLVRLPIYRWHRAVVVPRGHPLASAGKLTLKKLAEYPIVTYVFSIAGRSSLAALFETAGLSLDIALTARDADVIKTYVRIGLGVGIVARQAIDPKTDSDLVVIDASHLFESHLTWIGFRRSALLRAYMYEFIELLAPQLPRKLVREIEKLETQDDIDRRLSELRGAGARRVLKGRGLVWTAGFRRGAGLAAARHRSRADRRRRRSRTSTARPSDPPPTSRSC